MEKAVNALNKAASSNAVVNISLLGCFGALSARSMIRQRDIEALEAEKESLTAANKAMKNTIWGWKKQLYAEAEAAKGSKTAPFGVSVSKIKAIYGEAAAPAAPVEDGKSSAASKIII